MATIYDLDELKAQVAAQSLILETLRDLALDEHDTNRSDEHLIAVIEELVHEHRMMKTAVNWDVLHDMRKGWQIEWPKKDMTTGGTDGNH